MNFDFSDEQKQLRTEARRFLEDRCPPAAVRAILEGDEPYDRALWTGLAEMGFLGAAIPEAYGGLGLGHLELCVVAEELGRVLAPVPVSSSIYLAAEFLVAAGTDAQKQAWLPRLASGEAIGTFAFAEGVGRVTPRSIQLTASGGALTGSKAPVPDGAVADVAVVAARTAAGGADVILDMVGGDYVQRNIDCLKDEGRLVQIAFQAGASVELNLIRVMLKRLTLTGSTLRARPADEKARLAAAVEATVWPWLERGLAPAIDRTFPLAEAGAAHAHLEAGEHVGKVVLVP